MKEMDITEALKDWLKPKDLASLDKLVKYLDELGEKAKNIKTMDDAYAFAKNDLGMKCTKKEFNEGAKYLEYIGDKIKKETEKAEAQAKNAYLDAVAVYMTVEKHLADAQGEYAKFSKKLEAEMQSLATDLSELCSSKIPKQLSNCAIMYLHIRILSAFTQSLLHTMSALAVCLKKQVFNMKAHCVVMQ